MAKIDSTAKQAADLKVVQDVFVADKNGTRLDDSQHTLLDPPRKPVKKSTTK